MPFDRHEYWRGWKKRQMESTLVSFELLTWKILQFRDMQVNSPNVYPKGGLTLLTTSRGWADLALQLLSQKLLPGWKGV